MLMRPRMTVAATGGHLNIIGSQVSGNNVALAAANHLNLLSQAEQHTDKSDSHNSSGEVGLSIGQTTGIYLTVAAGQAQGHGNGTTHADTTVNAARTLTLISGGDTTIKGAQAKGNQVLADIGGNLNIASEQDTNDYAAHSVQAGVTLVYGFSNGGVGVSGSVAASKTKSNYASVNDISGIGAGSDGLQIHVNGNTDLKGGVIASTADASKNLLDTGSLTFSDIQNKGSYSSESISIGGGMGTSGNSVGMGNGISGSIGVPQHDNASSTTHAGIANGTIITRNGTTDLSGLDRSPTLDNQSLKPIFNAQKVADNQLAGQLAGQVGMTAAGDIEQHMAQNATSDADRTSWSAGGTNSVLLHGIVGAATAALGGGNATGGALGAGTSEAASGAMQDYLIKQGIKPSDPMFNTLMQLGSAAIGGAVGGGAGAATALDGEQYNYALHPDQKVRLAALEKDMTPEQAEQVEAAGCALAHCAAQLADDGSEGYKEQVDLQNYGNSDDAAWARDLLKGQLYDNGSPVFQSYSALSEGVLDYVAKRQTELKLNSDQSSILRDYDPSDPYGQHFATQDYMANSLEATYENTLIKFATFRISSLLPDYVSGNASAGAGAVGAAVNTSNGRTYSGGGGNFNPIPSASIVVGWVFSPDYKSFDYNSLGSSASGSMNGRTVDNYLNGASLGGSYCVDIYCAGGSYSFGSGGAFEIGLSTPLIKNPGIKIDGSISTGVLTPVGSIPGGRAYYESQPK
jgi:hypothetical protein